MARPAPRPLTLEWLAMLPPVLQEDPWIIAILDAQAREMERLIAAAEEVGYGLVPTLANEVTLPLWEALLGLPVNPPNTSVETRVNLVVSRMIRGDGSGAQWEAAMARATSGTYRYTEHDSGDPLAPNYTLNINTALPTGMTIESLRDYVRAITPANLHIDVVGGQTYEELRARHATYTAARDAYRNYDNMRYGAV
jgi:hypothetical protein